jgi:holo-[acyl-carrier protein] synthase
MEIPKGAGVVAIGTDLIACRRIAGMLEKHREPFLDRVFCRSEQEYCLKYRDPSEHLAGRWAAKEAVMKILGTGWSQGVTWTDIEVVRDAAGKPSVHLHGEARLVAERLGIARVLISISHCSDFAVAMAAGVDR